MTHDKAFELLTILERAAVLQNWAMRNNTEIFIKMGEIERILFCEIITEMTKEKK